MKRRSLFQSLVALPIFAWLKPPAPHETVRYEMEERHTQLSRRSLLEPVQFDIQRSVFRLVSDKYGVIQSYKQVTVVGGPDDAFVKILFFDERLKKKMEEWVKFEKASWHFGNNSYILYKSL